MKHRIFETFTGPFVLIQKDDGTILTTWLTAEVRSLLRKSQQDDRLLPQVSQRLERYFSGKSVDFSGIDLPDGGEFFRRCWDACRLIPRGQTRTYAELARMAGSTPAAARAAGQAMRSNPMPIITPCHRVIGSGGKLHGFAGSLNAAGKELSIKAALLEMEGAASQNKPRASSRSAVQRPARSRRRAVSVSA